MKTISIIAFNGRPIPDYEISFAALDDGFCEDCVWCYDTGGDLPCNSEFECDGQAQLGLKSPPMLERAHQDYLSKRIYELNENCEPRLKKI